jgi:hypothetical protein
MSPSLPPSILTRPLPPLSTASYRHDSFHFGVTWADWLVHFRTAWAGRYASDWHGLRWSNYKWARRSRSTCATFLLKKWTRRGIYVRLPPSPPPSLPLPTNLKRWFNTHEVTSQSEHSTSENCQWSSPAAVSSSLKSRPWWCHSPPLQSG